MKTQILRSALAALCSWALSQALGATYTVNTSADNAVVSNCTGHTTNCSLRGAIMAANANSGDTINFSIIEFCPITGCAITLSSALPDINAPMTITGPTSHVIQRSSSAATNFRIFNVTTNGPVNFASLTIAKGVLSGFGNNGAGIQNAFSGAVNITNCTVRDNQTESSGGGIYNNSGTVTITGSMVFQNKAHLGGGIFNSNGSLSITQTTLSANKSEGPANGTNGAAGGAIYGDTGTVTITNSTMSGNSAVGGFGSTIGGDANGGAINTESTTTLKISNCTISGNTAFPGAGGNNNNGQASGGGINAIGSTMVKSSIIALNTAAQSTMPDVKGPFASAGFNLIGKRDGSTGFTAATDQTGTIAAPLDPKLDSNGLQNNGGSTQTIALLLGSPAIDKGTSVALSGNLTTDQRDAGFPRKVDDPVIANATGGDGTDIDAFELQSICTFSLMPSSRNFPVAGGQDSVSVTAADSCPWTAQSNKSFITVVSGASGAGNGTVGYTVAANPNSSQRTGTITIAGLTFSVSQDGTNCGYSVSPPSETLDAKAATKTVSVTTTAGCAWTATSNDSFISINSGASGTGNGTVTYTVAANFGFTQRTGTLTVAEQTVTITQASATSLANISTRLRVETGDNVLIGGFIVSGTQPKRVIVHAIGPSLPFAGKLDNPVLELHGPHGLIETNDNWISSPNKQAIMDSGLSPSNDLESAIVQTLPANGTGYTAIVRGVNNGTGIGVVDAFDLDATVDSKLANISTRGLVQTGDNVLIAGTIILGQNMQKVIVRAIGPSLSQIFAGTIQDPTMELHDQNGGLLEVNDNWVDSPNKQAIIESGLAPSDNKESAIIRTLPANGAQYTAIVRGVNDTTGIAVVEVYALQ